MDSAFKERWTDALRSGDYDQGDGQLRRDGGTAGADRFCCLGVACDLFDPSGWEFDGDDWVYRRRREDGGWDFVFLPDFVRDEIGLGYKEMETLAAMNDRGESFHDIAAYIDTNI